MSEPPPPPITYEYIYLLIPDQDMDSAMATLNEHGASGWQLVGFIHSGGHYRVLMMREV